MQTFFWLLNVRRLERREFKRRTSGITQMFNLNPPSVLHFYDPHSSPLDPMHIPSCSSNLSLAASRLTKGWKCGVLEIDNFHSTAPKRMSPSELYRRSCIGSSFVCLPLFSLSNYFLLFAFHHAIQRIRTSLVSQLRIPAKFGEQQIFRIFSTFSFHRECRAQLGSNDRTTRPGVEVDRGEVLRVVGEVEEELAEVELKESMMVDRRRSRSKPKRASLLPVSKLSTSTVAGAVALQFERY